MKKIFLTGAIMVTCLTGSFGQAAEIAQLLLNVEKLAQFKQILSDMKKGYNILTGGYNTVKNIAEGNFSIHQVFLDGLMQVSPTVRNYRKVPEIIDHQMRLVKEYKAAWRRFSAAGIFKPGELEYIEKVYNRLFKSSLKNLDELTMIITANKLRMSDDERLAAIDRIHAETEDKIFFLRNFNNSTSVLALQREKEQKDQSLVKKLTANDN